MPLLFMRLFLLLFLLPHMGLAASSVVDTRGALYQLLKLTPKPSINGQGVVIAVLDSGIDFSHPALKQNRWRNTPEERYQTGSRDLGHGTAVAGILSSTIGIAPKSQVMDLQIADAKGVSSSESVKKALRHALSQKVKIINISLGIDLQILKELRQELGPEKFKKSLIVIAAGNFEEFLPRAHQFDNVLVVGATTLTESPALLPAKYSSYGPGVDLWAPAGLEVGNFTLNADWRRQGLYRNFNGTSSAAPVVSGVAALLAQQDPKAEGPDLRRRVLAKFNSK